MSIGILFLGVGTTDCMLYVTSSSSSSCRKLAFREGPGCFTGFTVPPDCMESILRVSQACM